MRSIPDLLKTYVGAQSRAHMMQLIALIAVGVKDIVGWFDFLLICMIWLGNNVVCFDYF